MSGPAQDTFDLTAAVARWRTAHAALPPDALDELEDGLRASVADLARAGLIEEEAFLVAARRSGTPGELEAEFRKVGAVDPRRVRWLAAGALLALLIPDVVRTFAVLCSLLTLWSGAPPAATSTTVVAAGVASFAVLALLGRSRAVRTRAVALVERPARGLGASIGAITVAITGAVLTVQVVKLGAFVAFTRFASRETSGHLQLGLATLGYAGPLVLLLVAGASLAARRTQVLSRAR